MRRTLVEEKIVVNKHIPKYNFERHDLFQALKTLWTKDDLRVIPERYRVQFTFILRVFCWTGARIGSFFDDHALKWRDVTLVLQRVPTGPWRLIFKIDQRWVKGNRDPENVVFGAVGIEHEKFMYDDAASLLTFAILDQVLYGYDSLQDLQRQRIPDGDNEMVLQIHESALDQPILRKCTKVDGVTDGSMPQATFNRILKDTFKNAGYTQCPTVHAIRRELGKKVDKLYTPAQRSQHLTQADINVFGTSYLARTSAVDGVHAFHDESIESDHITYFQGTRQFQESGLPCRLPASLERKLQAEKLSSSSYQKRKKAELSKFQEQWVKARNEGKIKSRGQTISKHQDRTIVVDILSRVFPERGRLSQLMCLDQALSPERRWEAMQDLLTLCQRDSPVLYPSPQQPINDKCPVTCCQMNLKR